MCESLLRCTVTTSQIEVYSHTLRAERQPLPHHTSHTCQQARLPPPLASEKKTPIKVCASINIQEPQRDLIGGHVRLYCSKKAKNKRFIFWQCFTDI